MSTKIYNGFRIPSVRNLKSIKEITERIRPGIEELAKEKLSKFYVIRSIESLYERAFPQWRDSEREKPINEKDSVYYQVWNELMDRQRTMVKEQRRDPAIDVDFSLVFIPHAGGTIGIYYSEDEKMSDLWLMQPEVQSYGYWNNTDRPDDVTPREWNDRKKAWDKAFEKTSVPAEAGFTVELSRNMSSPDPTIDDILKRYSTLVGDQPDFLAKNFATNSLMNEYISKEFIKLSEENKTEMEKDRVSMSVSVYLNLSRKWRDEILPQMETQALIHERTNQIMERIPTLTRDMLMKTEEFLNPKISEIGVSL